LHQAAGVSQHAIWILGNVIMQRTTANVNEFSARLQAAEMVLQVHF